MMYVFRRPWLGFILFMLALLLFAFCYPARTPPIRDGSGKIAPGSVALLERVELGGVKQSILIRGEDRHNPIVLFLHGGPGYPQIAYARKYQRELEKDFVVVNWDQRGSGKSYHWSMSSDDLQIEKLVQDTLDLTEYLERKFGQRKIYLVGHSWGSLLGVWTVQRYPEHYYAYIGVGQVADHAQGEALSYRFALEEARKRVNAAAVKALEEIGPPPYRNPRKDTTLERKWVTAFGGSERRSDSYKALLEGVLLAPEYTWADGIRLLRGDAFSRNAILSQTENANLLETVPELKVPVYLCMGKYDYMTPSEVAYRYYEQLVAPEKHFVWFEESAHFPHFEEADKFRALMLNVRDQTQ